MGSNPILSANKLKKCPILRYVSSDSEQAADDGGNDIDWIAHLPSHHFRRAPAGFVAQRFAQTKSRRLAARRRVC
jgi:hypothetical protein